MAIISRNFKIQKDVSGEGQEPGGEIIIPSQYPAYSRSGNEVTVTYAMHTPGVNPNNPTRQYQMAEETFVGTSIFGTGNWYSINRVLTTALSLPAITPAVWDYTNEYYTGHNYTGSGFYTYKSTVNLQKKGVWPISYRPYFCRATFSISGPILPYPDNPYVILSLFNSAPWFPGPRIIMDNRNSSLYPVFPYLAPPGEAQVTTDSEIHTITSLNYWYDPGLPLGDIEYLVVHAFSSSPLGNVRLHDIQFQETP